MATGAYDANGIWQYGEDDNIALFSDLLNLGTESTSDAFTDDRARIATLEAGSLAGLIPIKPSTVTVATGSASVNTLGVVTFSGATSVTLNNVFSSGYKNYGYLINISAVSDVSTVLNLQLASSGTASNTNYNWAGVRSLSGTPSLTATEGSSAGYWSILEIGSAAPPAAVSGEIFEPASSNYSEITYRGMGYSGSYLATRHGSGRHFGTSYDGVKIYPAAGTFGGTIQILGYND